MSTSDDISKCANCGKFGDDLKRCNACKLVKYCNATCQKAHRPKHKKACRKRASELHHEALFKQPPPNEDCPVCFLPLPIFLPARKYQACCGKVLCMGCFTAMFAAGGCRNEGGACPFCRKQAPYSDEAIVEKLCGRMEMKNDAEAFVVLGSYYVEGAYGLRKDEEKAFELYTRAAAIGSITNAHYALGTSYFNGQGVEKDKKKAKHHFEIAAIGGDVEARYGLGNMEIHAQIRRGVKHWMISARAGHDKSLEAVKTAYNSLPGEFLTKEEFEVTLRAHKDSVDGMKSEQRDLMAEVRRLNS